METILKRDIVDKVVPYLPTDDVIVFHGSRQVGKTSLLIYLQNMLQKEGKKTFYIDLEDSRYVRIIDEGVESFLRLLEENGLDIGRTEKKIYVFLDEIQYLLNPSSFLKLISDHTKSVKLIVTGSSSFAIKEKFRDSLVGRTINFELSPLSFQEFLVFKKYPAGVFPAYTPKKIEELRTHFQEFVLFGGYPRIVLTSDLSMKEKYLQQIVDTYVRKDIRDLAKVKDLDKFNKLLETLAAQSGHILNVAELAATTRIARPTVEKYLFILENTYILRLVRPFSRNLRSELYKSPKIFFYDTGLMQMLWLKSLAKEVLGSVFETAIFTELVKHYGREVIFYWRTKDKQEIDFILRLPDTLLPIEAKLNFGQFRATTVNYFKKRYGCNKYHVVGLQGEKKEEYYIHPWELFTSTSKEKESFDRV